MASYNDTSSQITPSSQEIFKLFQDDLSVDSVDPSSCVAYEKIATFLRIRPLDIPMESTPFTIIDSNHLRFEMDDRLGIQKSIGKPRHDKYKVAKFSHIFDGSSTQQNVFTKCCLPLVNDVIDGTNALLFCFGTTSSGKSYTMRGPPDDPTADPGLIPLSLKKIFSSRKFIDQPLIGKSKFSDICLLDQDQQLMERQFKESILSSTCCRNVSAFSSVANKFNFNEDGYQYICYLSYFEIYNGLVYDLLLPSSSGRGSPLTLFPDENQRYYVKDLKSVMVASLTEALRIYSFGWTNLQRNIQETGLNKNSSRSHSFLSISLVKFREDDGQLLESHVSHLTLGDLAGSERQNKTHSEGLRVKEGGNINVSLMHLKECFNQTKLSQKNPNRNFVIPFRNSSLTKFFQPYLTGTGRVWMIININPSPTLLNETCGSLDLGETASHISTNSTIQLKLEESKRRMTQVWLQSSQRWSSFTGKYKALDVPQVVIENDDADGKEDNYCNIRPSDVLINRNDRDEKIRTEVIQQFETILKELMQDHEQDMQATRDNYEKTMEARLALSDKKYRTIIDNLQAKIENLTTELFKASEAIVHLEEDKTVEPIILPEQKFHVTSEKQTQTKTTASTTTDTQTEIISSAAMETQTEIAASSTMETQTEIISSATMETQTENLVYSTKETQTEAAIEQPVFSVTETQTENVFVVTADKETQCEEKYVPLEEFEKLKETQSEPKPEPEPEPEPEPKSVPLEEFEKLKEEFETLQEAHLKLSQELAESKLVKIIQEIENKPVDNQSVNESPPVEFVPCELESADSIVSPKKPKRTLSSTCAEAKPSNYTEKNFSVKKAREITIDSNYLPASVSELTKRKRKEDAVDSPTTEITNEYLRMMFPKASCPPSTTKKSVKKSARKPSRKSRKISLAPEPVVAVGEEVEDEDEIEEDELAGLLVSQKKGKKKSKEELSAIKIPTKRKKIPVNNEFLETTLSPHIEDEPIQEANVKGGRVLRPRRKIKF